MTFTADIIQLYEEIFDKKNYKFNVIKNDKFATKTRKIQENW